VFKLPKDKGFIASNIQNDDLRRLANKVNYALKSKRKEQILICLG